MSTIPISVTKLFSLFEDKVGREAAESLVEYVQQAVKEVKEGLHISAKAEIQAAIQNNAKDLATKEDISSVKQDIRRIEDRLFFINRSIYTIGLIQFLAIVGSVLAIVKFVR